MAHVDMSNVDMSHVDMHGYGIQGGHNLFIFCSFCFLHASLIHVLFNSNNSRKSVCWIVFKKCMPLSFDHNSSVKLPLG